MRYLGIDYGAKKVGLALSDESGSMGFPHSIIPNTPRLLADLLALAAKEGVGAFVIGDSLDYGGKGNPVAAGAKALGTMLGERSGLPVFFEWEGLTSAQARRQGSGDENDGAAARRSSRAPKQDQAVDASAAALILTSYLSKAVSH